MQSLSERKHKALIAVLQQLSELSNQLGSSCRYVEVDIRDLDTLYVRYQELLSELGDCIAAYENLYKDMKTNVLAPQLRQIRKQMDHRTSEYHILKQQLVAVRSY